MHADGGPPLTVLFVPPIAMIDNYPLHMSEKSPNRSHTQSSGTPSVRSIIGKWEGKVVPEILVGLNPNFFCEKSLDTIVKILAASTCILLGPKVGYLLWNTKKLYKISFKHGN